jgi:Ca2+-transporting ATPase
VQEIRIPGASPIDPGAVEKDVAHRLEAAWPLLATASLCNDAKSQEEGYLGEGTEVALLQVAKGLDFPISRASEALPRREEIPFESERKMMSTINALNDNGHDQDFFPFSSPLIVLTKGAPEVVLERCDRFLTPAGIKELTESDRNGFAAEAEEMADRTLRTLAYACRPIPEMPGEEALEELEDGLIYLGITGMMDPARPEVFKALDLCRKAYIEVVMITGDHAATARAVAEELSILTPDKEMITGEELAYISDEELTDRVDRIAVYARVSPADKVKIVRAWKTIGKTVAMTGDGVNDAPALKNADIGVAMGITGTDVSKEASDMVLQDDNFATIVNAVREGRIIYDNLKKFIYFLLSCNMSEVSTMFIGMLFASVTPLTAVQVLWMNLVTDGLPALALGVDTPVPNIMERPPRDPNVGILNRSKQVMILWQGLILSIGALVAFFVSYYLLFTDDIAQVQTVVFTTLVLSQLMHSFNSRSETLSVVEMPFFENKALWAAIGASLALQLAVILIPPLMDIFKTAYVGAAGWGLIIACSIIPVIVIDRVKVMLRGN